MSKPLTCLLAACLATAGCTLGPDYVRPTAPLAPAFVHAANIDTRSTDANWWRGFADPLLVTLVDRAVARNTDLAQARARIDQARAAATAAGAVLMPALDATGGITTVSQSRDTAIGRITRAIGAPRGSTEYTLGAQASWEMDLFGGLRRGREAARDELAATQANEAALAIAVAAETADAYLTLRALQARLAVASDQERNEVLFASLVRQRFEHGIAAERDLNRTIAQLEGVRAAMAPLRAGVEAQLNRLDVLVGEAPGTNRAVLIEPRPVPPAPAPAGGGVPIDLLRRRPDIVAAENRLAASSARTSAAIAEYYPHLSLSSLFGVASLGTGHLFTGGAVQASGAAGLRWRLFDFGRIDAEVAGARGRQAEALAAWRGSVLAAAEDVETALAWLDQTHAERGSLEREVAALDRARSQTRDAYAGGVAGLIEVTDAERETLAATDRLALARAAEARAAVAAYRALGGGWQAANGAALASPPGKLR
jgi:NodT family efflux transporter outer membrane factor (OMF) lipoprotein